MLRQALVVPLKKLLVVGGVFSTLAAYRLCSSGCSWDPGMSRPRYAALRLAARHCRKRACPHGAERISIFA
jgi:hypothetical protein